MSSLFDILTMSDFFKIAKCTRFLWKCVSSQNHPKFDILVMSDFSKIAKCTKFVRNWVSYKNHPKFDILVMSDFSNIAKCTKFVRNWVSYKNHPKDFTIRQPTKYLKWSREIGKFQGGGRENNGGGRKGTGDFDFFWWISLNLHQKTPTYIYKKMLCVPCCSLYSDRETGISNIRRCFLV